MKLYGLIGYPLGHSFSQKYFTEKFLQLGITNCRYDVFPLPSVNDFTALIKNNDGLCGLNVTIPHKQSIVSFLHDTTHLPPGLTACNCIKVRDGKLIGYNTDVIGFELSLKELLKPNHTKALVLGNGGAAEAVKFVLQKLNIAYKVVSRNLHNDSHLTYNDIDEAVVKEHLLIINTTPLGTYPNVNECPNIPYSHLTTQHYLFDLVYNPVKTLFLQKGEEKRTAIKNGYDMLVIQAEESWEIWNDIS
jgi:shikimate dehydrogenase